MLIETKKKQKKKKKNIKKFTMCYNALNKIKKDCWYNNFLKRMKMYEFVLFTLK